MEPEKEQVTRLDLDPDKLGLFFAAFFSMIVFALLCFVVKANVETVFFKTTITFAAVYVAVFILAASVRNIVLPEIMEEEEEISEEEKVSSEEGGGEIEEAEEMEYEEVESGQE